MHMDYSRPNRHVDPGNEAVCFPVLLNELRSTLLNSMSNMDHRVSMTGSSSLMAPSLFGRAPGRMGQQDAHYTSTMIITTGTRA